MKIWLDFQPPSPEIVRRFKATYSPGYGKNRVYHGKAYDPEQTVAEIMTHGVCTQSNGDVRQLVNPLPKSRFQQHLIDRKESIYDSHVNAPLGSTRDQRKHLPPTVDPKTFTFGVWSERGRMLCWMAVH